MAAQQKKPPAMAGLAPAIQHQMRQYRFVSGRAGP
jgi:hypothetical protein